MKNLRSEPLYDWCCDLQQDDNEINKFLVIALEDFEKSFTTTSRYVSAKMESDIEKAKLPTVSNATAKDTKYCTRPFTE